MSNWHLPNLLAGLHEDIESRLGIVRGKIGHQGKKGDASEAVWIELLDTYLPQRYKAATAHVVDSEGVFSEQIDVVVFDRQYTPFIFNYQKQVVIPAEAIYAVFEAKQTINADHVQYAQQKVASVRRLHRTSLPIPTADKTVSPKPPQHILGGVLTFGSKWSPALGEHLLKALGTGSAGRLDLGCVAAHGTFGSNADGSYTITQGGKPATAFLFELIARLQSSATVPMIDVRAYARWLAP